MDMTTNIAWAGTSIEYSKRSTLKFTPNNLLNLSLVDAILLIGFDPLKPHFYIVQSQAIKNFRNLQGAVTMKQLLSCLLAVSLVVINVGAAFAQQYPQPGDGTTNAVVQNKNMSGQSATVVETYYRPDGTVAVTTSGTVIQSRAVREFKTAEVPGLPSGFQGSAVLGSNEGLAAVVSIQYRNVPGDILDPSRQTQAAYNATSAPATTLYFPSVWRFNAIVSRISIQNTENQPANITLTFKKRDGAAAGSLNATLPAYGQRTFYLGNASDVPPNFPADFRDGSVTVESTNGRLLAGASTATWANRAGAYQGLTESNKGKVLYAPSHYRFIFNAPANWQNLPATQWTLYSALNLQNTSTTATANVKLTYTARGATTPSLVKNITIPPLSAAGLNTQNGGDFPATDFYALSKAGNGLPDWDGSVLIESDQDLVGTNVTNWGSLGYADLYALAGPSEGSNLLFLPAQYRLHYTNTSGWSQWSAVNVQNIGDTTISESNLFIDFVDVNGNVVKSFTGAELNPATKGDGLGPGEAIGLNTRNGGDLPASAFNSFPTVSGRPSFIGGVIVRAPAGSKLLAVGNIVYFNRASVYNGVP